MPTILIGTDKGVFRLGSNGNGIKLEVGPSTVSFLTTAGEKVFALTKDNALWVRTTQGEWQLMNSRAVAEEIWSFSCDPRVGDRLYIGVSPALLYRSDDGGKTWVACESIKRIPGYEKWTFPPPPHIPHIRYIAPDPQKAGAVYIGAEEGGIYYTNDGGETWKSLNEGLYWDVHTVTPGGDGKRLYATTGAGFHRSDDGGEHWRHITTGIDRRYTIPFLILPEQADRVFTGASATPPPGWVNGANAAIYRSNDGGEHWEKLGGGLPPQFDTMVWALVVDETGGIYAATKREVFASFDKGDNWQLMAENLPEVRSVAVASTTQG